MYSVTVRVLPFTVPVRPPICFEIASLGHGGILDRPVLIFFAAFSYALDRLHAPRLQHRLISSSSERPKPGQICAAAASSESRELFMETASSVLKSKREPCVRTEV